MHAKSLPAIFVTGTDGDSAVYLAGEDVSAELRSQACGELASRLAGDPRVRRNLLQRQRDFRRPPGLVADGRDMGTVVFPDARLKIFLVASARERARRRHEQLLAMGSNANLHRIYAEILERDRRDSQRRHSPLTAADDARRLDTTGLIPEAAVEQALRWAVEAGLVD